MSENVQSCPDRRGSDLFAEIQARLPRLENMLELRQVKVSGFIWLRNIVEKIEAKHRVSPDEVEEVFLASTQFRRLEKGKVEGENVYGAYGQTEAGRYLTVIFIRKLGGRALIITARDMDSKERRQYGR